MIKYSRRRDTNRDHAQPANHAKPQLTAFASDSEAVQRDAGVPVAEVMADIDKVTQGDPAAGRVHAGRVWFPAQAAWQDKWCDELASFPSGLRDDQVDTLAYAARVLTTEWTPRRADPRRGLDPYERAIALARRAATCGGFDPMTIQY
jgi:predicted phage terminase large subunit-like protein